jgi:predicted alpha/beta hydrolase
LCRAHDPSGAVVANGATAVPHRFYRRFATALAEAGYTALTWDYRGVGASRPPRLRGFRATMRDWALVDMPGVVDWAATELRCDRLFLVGHSFGGQAAGLLDNAERVTGMVTFSSQSGYWRRQGGGQKAVVAFYVYVVLPLLARLLGYVPMSWLGAGEDLPRGVAEEWARWCRHPKYLLGDETLPLERYRSFWAPVLAYSFGDDKWGTREAVDAMMQAYPNLERRHLEPSDVGLPAIGHLGFFRPVCQSLWPDVVRWLDAR